MKLLIIKPTKKSTTRFTILGKQGFIRKRVKYNRFGFGNLVKTDKPKSFNQVHFFKYTIALESKKGRNLFNFAFNAK